MNNNKYDVLFLIKIVAGLIFIPLVLMLLESKGLFLVGVISLFALLFTEIGLIKKYFSIKDIKIIQREKAFKEMIEKEYKKIIRKGDKTNGKKCFQC